MNTDTMSTEELYEAAFATRAEARELRDRAAAQPMFTRRRDMLNAFAAELFDEARRLETIADSRQEEVEAELDDAIFLGLLAGTDED